MQKFNKPICEKLETSINPFANSLSIRYFGIKTKEYEEVENNIKLNKEIKIESEIFIKLFSNSENRILVNGLSGNSKSLLLWICYELESGKDYIWINRERYMTENRIKSNTTYLDAIKELVRYYFIDYSNIKDVFWINPNFFFKGNRIKKYPNNLKQVNND